MNLQRLASSSRRDAHSSCIGAPASLMLRAGLRSSRVQSRRRAAWRHRVLSKDRSWACRRHHEFHAERPGYTVARLFDRKSRKLMALAGFLRRGAPCLPVVLTALGALAMRSDDASTCGASIGSVRVTFTGDLKRPSNKAMHITHQFPLRPMPLIALGPLERSFGAIRGSAGTSARAATLLHQAAIVIPSCAALSVHGAGAR